VGAMAVHRAPLLEHGAKSPPQVSSQKNNISRLSTLAHIRGLTTSAMPELPYPANLCNVEHWCNPIPHPSYFLKKQEPLIILGDGVNQLSRSTTAALFSPT